MRDEVREVGGITVKVKSDEPLAEHEKSAARVCPKCKSKSWSAAKGDKGGAYQCVDCGHKWSE